jgi:5-methylcytosine-specific restriction endonuclease McrA
MPHKDPEKAREYCRQYREAHAAQLKESKRQHYITNREQILARRTKPDSATAHARNLKYREANAVRLRERARNKYATAGSAIRAAVRNRYAQDPEKVRERVRDWLINNPEKKRAQRHNRRARLAAAPGSGVTEAQWQAILRRANGCCTYCGQPCAKLTMDHIVPIAKGGAHDVSNIAPACDTCNKSKGDQNLAIWYAWKFNRKMTA